jgi:hypothetical protein
MGAKRARRSERAVKYRYTITNEGTVEADTTAEAETAAFEAMELGAGIYICTIEPLPGEARAT